MAAKPNVKNLMRDGVTMMDPETVFLSHDTQIGSDSILEPNIIFGPGVTIDSGVCIKAFSHLEGTKVPFWCRCRTIYKIAARGKSEGGSPYWQFFVKIKKCHD